MTALSDAKTYLAKQAASGVQATMHADHIEVILARLVAEIEAAPSGELFAAYPIGSRDFALADDRGESIDLRPYVGQTVRLLALDSGGAGEVGS